MTEYQFYWTFILKVCHYPNVGRNSFHSTALDSQILMVAGEWFEIGTEPTMQTHNVVCTDEKSTNKKRVFKRFNFKSTKTFSRLAKQEFLLVQDWYTREST